MNLLFCINGGYTGPLLDCLDSIVLHGGEKHYDVYLLSSDLAEETQQQLCRQVPAAVALHFISVPRELFEDFPETDRYPQEIYYRLAAPLLLPPELDRILYLDADIVVINPLGPLYRSDFEGNLFMACTHTRELLTRANSHRLGLEEPVPYINTGVILMELNGLRQTIDLSAVRQYALEHFDALLLPIRISLPRCMAAGSSSSIVSGIISATASWPFTMPIPCTPTTVWSGCGKTPSLSTTAAAISPGSPAMLVFWMCFTGS